MGVKNWNGGQDMERKKLSISNNIAISAVYFALLQCGYDFYSIERDPATVNRLGSFIMPDSIEYGFFFGSKAKYL